MIRIPAGILAGKIGKEKAILYSYSIFDLSTILMIVLVNDVSCAYILPVNFGLQVGISELFKGNNSKICVKRI